MGGSSLENWSPQISEKWRLFEPIEIFQQTKWNLQVRDLIRDILNRCCSSTPPLFSTMWSWQPLPKPVTLHLAILQGALRSREDVSKSPLAVSDLSRRSPNLRFWKDFEERKTPSIGVTVPYPPTTAFFSRCFSFSQGGIYISSRAGIFHWKEWSLYFRGRNTPLNKLVHFLGGTSQATSKSRFSPYKYVECSGLFGQSYCWVPVWRCSFNPLKTMGFAHISCHPQLKFITRPFWNRRALAINIRSYSISFWPKDVHFS